MTKPKAKQTAPKAEKKLSAEERNAKLGIVRPRNREARVAREKQLASPALRSRRAASRLPAPGTAGRDKLIAKTKASALAKKSAVAATGSGAKSAATPPATGGTKTET